MSSTGIIVGTVIFAVLGAIGYIVAHVKIG
jgi:hypothetical protein